LDTIINIQSFISHYLRNYEIRKTCKFKEKSVLFSKFNFSEIEIKLFNQIDFILLERLANKLQKERINNLKNNFHEFYNYLKEQNKEDIFRNFVNNDTGSLNPVKEIDRFYTYAKDYLNKTESTKYIKDLLDYTYNFTLVSKSKLTDSNNVIELDFAAPIYIKKPYKVFSLNYDVESFSMNNMSKEKPTYQKTYKMLIQKNYLEPTEIHFFEIEDDDNFFVFLEQGITPIDLIHKAYTSEQGNEWREQIIELYELNVIGH